MKTDLQPHEIERLLRADDDTPTPPADLLARLREDIPDDLGWTAPEAANGSKGSPGLPARRSPWLALAAVLVAAIGASYLTVRLMQDPTASPEAALAPAGVRVEPEVEAPQGDPASVGDRAEAARKDRGIEIGEAGEKGPVVMPTVISPSRDGSLDDGAARASGVGAEGDAPASQRRDADLADIRLEGVGNELARPTDTAGAGDRSPSEQEALRSRLRVAEQRESRPAAEPTVPGRQGLREDIVVTPAAPARSQPAAETAAGAPPPHADFRPAAPAYPAESVAPKAKKVPIPDPTPGAPPPSAEEEAKLRALGYVGDDTVWMVDGVEISDQGVIGSSPTSNEPSTFEAYVETTTPSDVHRRLEEPEVEPSAAKRVDTRVVTDRVATVAPAPFVDATRDALSTFGLDVDTGSYTRARAALDRGVLPSPFEIRVEELVNRFDYGDAPPRGGRDFALYAEAAPSPFSTDPRRLTARFHVRGRAIDESSRAPADLVFVIDTSGSMAQENRIGLVQQALTMLIDALRPEDRIALVTYGSEARIDLPHTADHGAIRAAIAALGTGGSTNAEAGLVQAYRLAEAARRPGTIARVILCSDGVANVGRTDPDGILGRVAGAAARGIELTTVGFGMGNYNDSLMEQLADRGNGRYAYVDNLTEADRIFVHELTGTLQTIAAEAKVQVAFDPVAVARYRLLGYENRAIADEDFRNDAVDAGEIGSGHAVTAVYELELRDGVRADRLVRPIATLTLRYGSVAKKRVVEQLVALTGAQVADAWHEASSGLRLATLVAAWGEALREGADPGRLTAVLAELQMMAAERAGDTDVAELVGLVGRSVDLARAR